MKREFMSLLMSLELQRATSPRARAMGRAIERELVNSILERVRVATELRDISEQLHKLRVQV